LAFFFFHRSDCHLLDLAFFSSSSSSMMMVGMSYMVNGQRRLWSSGTELLWSVASPQPPDRPDRPEDAVALPAGRSA
jgi:hypothetical protein